MYENANIPNRSAFLRKAQAVADDLGIPLEWLMAVMASETGSTFRSDISNIGCMATKGDASKCAVGLIQFMPDTAASLVYGSKYNSIPYNRKWSDPEATRMRDNAIDRLKAMSNVEQLDYVYKYFYPYRNKITRFVDLYLVTFYPVALTKPDSFILGSEKSAKAAKDVYNGNKGIDQNGDGLISVADFKKWIARNKNIPQEKVQQEVTTVVKAEKYTKRNWLPIGLTVAATGTALFLLFKFKGAIIKSLNK